MSEIKPRVVEGEARCSEQCPRLLGNAEYCDVMRGRLIPDELSICWPYYRKALAEEQEKVARLEREWDHCASVLSCDKAVKTAQRLEFARSALAESQAECARLRREVAEERKRAQFAGCAAQSRQQRQEASCRSAAEDAYADRDTLRTRCRSLEAVVERVRERLSSAYSQTIADDVELNGAWWGKILNDVIALLSGKQDKGE